MQHSERHVLLKLTTDKHEASRGLCGSRATYHYPRATLAKFRTLFVPLISYQLLALDVTSLSRSRSLLPPGEHGQNDQN